MAIYVISDLHLSTNKSTNKSMEVFGVRWTDYINRIKTNWNRLVEEDDTVIVNGDISWAMTLQEAKSDFEFLNTLNGTKIISKGNHDFWWSTVAKITDFFEKEGIHNIKLLHNSFYICEGVPICGSRGWYNDDKISTMPKNADYKKIVLREAMRLEHSLKEAAAAAPETKPLAFLHFPPVWCEFVCREIVDVLHKYDVERCYFGHIHGMYDIPSKFKFENIKFTITSADHLNFTPLFVEKNM